MKMDFHCENVCENIENEVKLGRGKNLGYTNFVPYDSYLVTC